MFRKLFPLPSRDLVTRVKSHLKEEDLQKKRDGLKACLDELDAQLAPALSTLSYGTAFVVVLPILFFQRTPHSSFSTFHVFFVSAWAIAAAWHAYCWLILKKNLLQQWLKTHDVRLLRYAFGPQPTFSIDISFGLTTYILEFADVLSGVRVEHKEVLDKSTINGLTRILRTYPSRHGDPFAKLIKWNKGLWIDTYTELIRVLCLLGNDNSLRTMKRLLKHKPQTDAEETLQAKLQEAIPVLEARLALEAQPHTLLRASSLKIFTSELLRPATHQEIPQEELLRPTQEKP